MRTIEERLTEILDVTYREVEGSRGECEAFSVLLDEVQTLAEKLLGDFKAEGIAGRVIREQ